MTPPVVAPLPCPFCGGAAMVHNYGLGDVRVGCMASPCIMSTRDVPLMKPEVWNTRPRPAVVDPVIVERASEIIAVTMFDSQVFGMQSMKRCVVDAWEEQPKDAQESIRRQSRLIAEKILALTAALGATNPSTNPTK